MTRNNKEDRRDVNGMPFPLGLGTPLKLTHKNAVLAWGCLRYNLLSICPITQAWFNQCVLSSAVLPQSPSQSVLPLRNPSSVRKNWEIREIEFTLNKNAPSTTVIPNIADGMSYNEWININLVRRCLRASTPIRTFYLDASHVGSHSKETSQLLMIER